MNMQNLSSKNSFQLFEIQEEFDINQDLLKNAYIELQKIYHPDSNISGVDIATSSVINSHYDILSSDVKRALLLYKLKTGVEINLVYHTNMPADFLIEQIEIHEQIDQAKSNESFEQLEAIECEILAKMKNITSQISDKFTNQDYDSLLNLIPILAYYDKLLHNLRETIINI